MINQPGSSVLVVCQIFPVGAAAAVAMIAIMLGTQVVPLTAILGEVCTRGQAHTAATDH
jgi:uncharacterized protein YybS (DUF2232 family)